MAWRGEEGPRRSAPVSALETSFTKLLGRDPSDAEVQKLYRVRDALGLKNNDALWLVLMALGHYESAYERMPQAIAEAARGSLANVKATADATMKASAESFKADMARAVAATAQEVARHTSRRQMWQWAGGAVAVAFVSLSLISWGAFSKGVETGKAEGYDQAKDEKAAAAWASTPQGQAAYRLAQGGDLDILVACNADGWKIEKKVCYPREDSDNMIHGWHLGPK